MLGAEGVPQGRAGQAQGPWPGSDPWASPWRWGRAEVLRESICSSEPGFGEGVQGQTQPSSPWAAPWGWGRPSWADRLWAEREQHHSGHGLKWGQSWAEMGLQEWGSAPVRLVRAINTPQSSQVPGGSAVGLGNAPAASSCSLLKFLSGGSPQLLREESLDQFQDPFSWQEHPTKQ